MHPYWTKNILSSIPDVMGAAMRGAMRGTQHVASSLKRLSSRERQFFQARLLPKAFSMKPRKYDCVEC